MYKPIKKTNQTLTQAELKEIAANFGKVSEDELEDCFISEGYIIFLLFLALISLFLASL